MPTPSHDQVASSARHSRLAVALIVLLLAASIAAGSAIYRQLVETEERQAQATLNHIADVETSAVSAWIGERLADAQVFSSGGFLGEIVHYSLKNGGPPEEGRRQLLMQLNAIMSTYKYREAAIFDTDGNIMVSAGNAPVVLDPIALATLQEAVSTNSIRISKMHVATPGGERVIDIIAPLSDFHERSPITPSVLFLRADADMHVQPFTQTLPFLSTATGAVLAEIHDDQVVTVSNPAQSAPFGYREVLPITPTQLISALVLPHAFTLTNAQGKELLTVVRQVGAAPWFLITTLEASAVRGNIRRIATIMFGVGMSVLLLLGTVVFLWWKKKQSDFRLQSMQAASERRLLQRQYEYLSRHANDLIVLTDGDGRIIELNEKASQMMGHERGKMTGAALGTLVPPASQPILQEAMKKLRREGTALFEIDCRRPGGDPVPVEISAHATAFGGNRVIQFIGRDLTEHRQSETALRESRERLDAILDSLLDVVWSFSPDLSRINYINMPAETVYGYPASAFISRPRLWFEVVHADDRQGIEEALRSRTPERPSCEAEYRVVRHDGQIRWLHSHVHLVVGNDGAPLRVDGVTTDITQRKMAEQQVQFLAYYDSVTGLPNRSLLNDRLAQAMHIAQRSGKKVAVLFMDLDNFKNINDSLGHHVGDMLLRALGETLLQCVREEDTVARIGGDEFLVVLPDIERGEQAGAVADKILAATARPQSLQGHEIHTTISIGISVYPEDGAEPHEVVKHADSALYQAKSQGRNNYQFFTQELNRQIVRNTTIERQLRQAIESGKLSLWYQPQINTSRGRMIGAEALLRWQRDGGGFMSPAEFIPVAEERGLIGIMGEWALREACRQCRAWQDEGLDAIPVAVNISPIQFQQKSFAQLVGGILRETGLNPRYLELEITESAIMRRAPLVAELANVLRELGIGISIDDFGTGYSSLSYLKQIPIDKIKIDRSFIADMLNDADDEAITYAIINLAHSLKLRVIAEGVESRAQLERLRAFGCNEVQGYYYSSAVSAESFHAFLADSQAFAGHAHREPHTRHSRRNGAA